MRETAGVLAPFRVRSLPVAFAMLVNPLPGRRWNRAVA